MKKQFRMATAAAAMMFPLAVMAHAKLLSTSPTAGAELAAAPKVLTLDFNESVKLAVLKVTSAGKEISVPYDGDASAAHVTVPLPALAAGTYQVKWSALTVDDGHVVKGAFSFVVKP
ncbi:MAG: copper resistance CopC family protein [Steroidobacteraceae bacterium]|jgi:methionine-rich copper-binding protein CopC